VRKKLLILANLWPESKTTAAGKHLLALIQSFKKAEYHVHFSCSMNKTYLGDSLNDDAITTHKIELNNDSFDQLLLSIQPDIVLFDRFISEEQYGWRVYKNLPNCYTLLNTEDLHSLRLARANKKEEKWVETDVFKREIASFLRVDKVLIVSEEEIIKLNDFLPSIASKLIYTPLVIDSKQIDYNLKRKPWSFVFFGSGKHPGNQATVKSIATMWPDILNIQPESTLSIIGAYYPDALISEVKKLKQVTFMGWIEKLEAELLLHEFLISPTPFGAGLKGKVLESINNGVLCLCSSQASEGIDTKHHSQFMHLNSEEAFLQSITILSESKDLIQKERSIQSELLKPFISFSNDSWITELLNDTIQNESNIIKQIMRHSTINSSENLGKYLTLKTNKN